MESEPEVPLCAFFSKLKSTLKWEGWSSHVLKTIIFGFLFSGWDVFSDILADISHVRPANVTRQFLANETVPDYCIALPNTTGEELQYYQCLEEGNLWATIISFGCIHLPGLASAGLFCCSVVVGLLTRKASCRETGNLLIAGLFFLIIPFPLVLMAIQTISLLAEGNDQMDLWSSVFLYAEGSLEASPQALLLLYLFFTDAERDIDWTLLASLISSLITISKTSLELFLNESFYGATSLSHILNHTETLNDSILKGKTLPRKLLIMAKLSPAFILSLAFKVGSIAIIWALLKDHVRIYLGIGIGITFIVAFIMYDGPTDEKAGSALFYSLTNITVTAKCPLGNRRKNYRQMMAISVTWVILHSIALVGLRIWVGNLPESTYLDHWSTNRFTLIKPTIFYPTISGLLFAGPLSVLALWGLKKQVLTLEEKEEGEQKFWEPASSKHDKEVNDSQMFTYI